MGEHHSRPPAERIARAGPGTGGRAGRGLAARCRLPARAQLRTPSRRWSPTSRAWRRTPTRTSSTGGDSGGSGDAVVGGGQRKGRVDALHGRGREARATVPSRQPDRRRLQRRPPDSLAATAGRPARFLFDSEAGRIIARYGVLGRRRSPADRHLPQGAVYKGLAIADHDRGAAPVRDRLPQRPGRRVGRRVEPRRSRRLRRSEIPAGYAPFGIQGIGDRSSSRTRSRTPTGDDVARSRARLRRRVRHGRHLLGRVAQRGQLNAPWGLAMAPAASAGLPATCSSATSATVRSTLTRCNRTQLREQPPRITYYFIKKRHPWRAARNRREAGHNRRPLGARVRERRHSRPEQDALLHRGPERRERRTVRLDRAEQVVRRQAAARIGRRRRSLFRRRRRPRSGRRRSSCPGSPAGVQKRREGA